MENSKISWTDHTFNPWIGCTKVSPGCAHCYAETLMDTRYGRVKWGKGQARSRTSHANWKEPLKWNHHAPMLASGARPRVFCASLSDWLDDEVPIEWLADMLDLVRRTPNLDWLLLSKRPQNWYRRISAAINHANEETAEWLEAWTDCLDMPERGDIPANVWIGTSVEDQQRADERIPELLKIPARVRFLSCEPLIGPVDLKKGLWKHIPLSEVPGSALDDGAYACREFLGPREEIHWVIVGGESGPGARPMHPEWARSLRDQCKAAGVAFHFKQWGEWAPGECVESTGRLQTASWFGDGWEYGTQTAKQSENTHADDAPDLYRVGKHASGRMLDGCTHNAFPEVSQ